MYRARYILMHAHVVLVQWYSLCRALSACLGTQTDMYLGVRATRSSYNCSFPSTCFTSSVVSTRFLRRLRSSP